MYDPEKDKDIELKKWAIQQANAWRWESGNTYQNTIGGGTRSQSEPDLIDRAQKIYNWVKS